MAQVKVFNTSVSLDGYAAGADQSIDNPLGVDGERLHEWLFAEDRDPVDDAFMDRRVQNVGATVMGRNMFGPVRGPWGDSDWTGWWGPNPPFHHPVFVLTHHRRDPVEMEGGTTFHFVDESIEDAVARALDAAGGQDVAIGGGASTVQAALRARLVDDLHVAVVPVLLHRGERLFDNLDGGPDGYEVAEFVSSPAVAHVRLVKSKD
jgi:dihydrofolate reductase